MTPIESLLLPIPGLNPAGISARYETSFLQLEEQIARLTSLNDELPDWSAISRDATFIITHQSKDMLVAVYLARAWFELHGPTGLRDGLLVIENIVLRYWEIGFPSLDRLHARRSAFQWLADGVTLDSDTTNGEIFTIAQRLHDYLSRLFPNGESGISGLIRQSIPMLSAEKSIGDTVPKVQTSPAQLTTDTTVIANRLAALAKLRESATWFIQQEPHSPVGFLAQRAADFGERDFQSVFRELLSNHQPAQQELWHMLGISNESNGPT